MWGKGKGCRLRAFARENSKYEKFKKKRENARIYIGLLKNGIRPLAGFIATISLLLTIML